MRRLSLFVGVLLSAGAFVALLILGSVLNPAPYRVVVVRQDIPAGARIDESMLAVDRHVRVDPRVAERVVQEGDLPRVIGRITTRPLYRGQMLMWADVVMEGNPVADERISRTLENPDLVAVELEVSENSPSVGVGDRVAIVLSVGGMTGMGIQEMLPQWTGAMTYPLASPGAAAFPSPPFLAVPGAGALPPEIAAAIMPAMASAYQNNFQPPLSKIVACGVVGAVRYRREMNPAYTGAEGESPYIETNIPEQMTVLVPREQMEGITFAKSTKAHGGSYDIVALSPSVDLRQCNSSTWGVHWPDVQAYFLAERLAMTGVISDPVELPGASARYGSVVQWTQWTMMPQVGMMPGVPPGLWPFWPITGVLTSTAPFVPTLPGVPPPQPPAPGTSQGEAVPTPQPPVSGVVPQETPAPVVPVASPTVFPTATPIAAPSQPSPAIPGVSWTNLLPGLACMAMFLLVGILVVLVLVRKRK